MPSSININYFSVPIQIQLLFSNLSGDQYLHTITVSRPVTCSQTEAEDNVNSTVSALQAVHESARLAQQGRFYFFGLFSSFTLLDYLLTFLKGKYSDARINLVSVQRLLQRAMKQVHHQKDYLSYIVQAEVCYILVLLFTLFCSLLPWFETHLLFRNWINSCVRPKDRKNSESREMWYVFFILPLYLLSNVKTKLLTTICRQEMTKQQKQCTK